MPASNTPLTTETVATALRNELHDARVKLDGCRVSEREAMNVLDQRKQDRMKAQEVVDRLRLTIELLEGKGKTTRYGGRLVGEMEDGSA